MANGQNRANVKIGANVKIVLKADQRTGKLTEGVVARLLTSSIFHPHGIKVQLTDGQVGRVQEIVGKECRVVPSSTSSGVAVNDNPGLEREANEMGKRH